MRELERTYDAAPELAALVADNVDFTHRPGPREYFESLSQPIPLVVVQRFGRSRRHSRTAQLFEWAGRQPSAQDHEVVLMAYLPAPPQLAPWPWNEVLEERARTQYKNEGEAPNLGSSRCRRI